ncbi:AMP-dependent synthetase/ligase [Thalassorhabdus alkalitolerans]|uniref:Acyl-CoA synthetase n=1 Tax=Thalassorhabdus alkalitolerans TaxID=2282697 RepID=A0ABW0YR60_9BACI
MGKDTFPKLLLELAESEPERTAFRKKSLGIWKEISWKEVKDNVESFALAIKHLFEFQKGDRMVILSDNRPEWIYAELACQSLGGVSTGLFQESTPEQLDHLINDCKAKIIVAEDQEQVDKVLKIIDHLPLVETIIFINPKGLKNYSDHRLIFWDDVQKAANESSEINIVKEIEQGNGEDPAFLCYSPGTMGHPKGILLSHYNLLATGTALQEVDPVSSKDDYLSFLPLAWASEQLIVLSLSFQQKLTINFPEEPSTALQDLREIGPHLLMATPRTYENIIARFNLRINDTSSFKKKVYNFFNRYGKRKAEADFGGKPLSLKEKVIYKFGDYLVFSAIRDHLGLARIKRAYINGASLGNEGMHFFHSIGVNVKQTYGATELSGISLVQRDGKLDAESVGEPLPHVDLKITEDKEILIKSAGKCLGYLNGEALNLDQDGYINLGDTGEKLEDGQVRLTGRKEEVITGVQGQAVAPSSIESKLKMSPYIQEALLYGKQQPYMVGLINISMENVGRWADKKQLSYTTYEDLSTNPDVIQLIHEEVSQITALLPESIDFKKFIILPKELNASEDEMTPTYKLRRPYVEQKYKQLLDSLYSSDERVSFTKGNVNEQIIPVISLGEKREVA